MSIPTNETAAIRQIVRAVKGEGFELNSVWDGDERFFVNSEREAIELLTSVEVSWLRVTREGKGFSIMFVIGNSDPIDMVADWSVTLDSVISPVIDSWF